MMKWKPSLGEFAKAWLEPGNEFDKFEAAVKKCGVVVGHLTKRKAGQFAKTISFFLRGSNSNSWKIEVIRKRVNLGWGKIPSTLCGLINTG